MESGSSRGSILDQPGISVSNSLLNSSNRLVTITLGLSLISVCLVDSEIALMRALYDFGSDPRIRVMSSSSVRLASIPMSCSCICIRVSKCAHIGVILAFHFIHTMTYVNLDCECCMLMLGTDCIPDLLCCWEFSDF